MTQRSGCLIVDLRVTKLSVRGRACLVRFRWLAELGPTTATMGPAGFSGLDGNTYRHDSGVSTASF